MPLKVLDDMYVDGVLTGGGSVGVDDDLEVTSGHTLDLTDSTIAGDFNLSGNARQARDKGGLVKAMVNVDAAGACVRSCTFDNSAVTCSFTAPNIYKVSFNFRVNDRYLQLTPETVTPPALQY